MNLFQSKPKEDTHAAEPVPQEFQKNQRVAIITGDKVEDTEFFYPYYRLTEAGYDVDVITADGGKFEGIHGLGLQTSRAVTDVGTGDYELLYLPGGHAPAELRKNVDIIHFIKKFAASGRPIAAVCHGPQLLITAELVRGKRMACWPEVREELEKAGGIFVDEPLVEDGQFITARMPGDLPDHLRGVLRVLENSTQMAVRRAS